MSYRQETRLRMVQLFDTATPLMSSNGVQEAGTVSQYRPDHQQQHPHTPGVSKYRCHVEKSAPQIPPKVKLLIYVTNIQWQNKLFWQLT